MADADAVLEPGIGDLSVPPATPPPAAPPTDDTVMSLVDHLGELRSRIFRSIIAVVAGAGVGFYFGTAIRKVLQEPLGDLPLQVLGVGDAFFIQVKIALITGIILAMPVLLYQLWAFIGPGLTPAERKTIRPWIPMALVFFAIGVLIAYLVLPFAIQFLFSFTDETLQARPAAGQYFDFVTTMFLAFGLVMEFPILLVGLSTVGIVDIPAAEQVAPDGDPRCRDLRGDRDPRRRPGQPVRPGRNDVPAVRTDHHLHQAQRAVTMDGDPGPAPDAVAEPAFVIVSGLSGGGKTAAAKLFEDLGYTVVDNLPGELLPDLAELVSADRTRFARVAIVLDVRSGDATLALAAMRGALEGRGIRPRVVFLEASRRRPDPALQRNAPSPSAWG